MEQCISDIKRWMLSRTLKMHDAKTEYLIGTQYEYERTKCTHTVINIGDSVVQATDCVPNLGANFDKHMSMEKHVTTKCRAAYAQLYNISNIRKYLDRKSAEQVIHALVLRHTDYRNALLTGLPKYIIKKLQMVHNTAVRVLCSVGKHANTQTTPLAADRVSHQVQGVSIEFQRSARS